VSQSGRARPARSSRVAIEVLAEAIPHIVWLADADGATDYLNDRGTAYTGYPREAHYGSGWLALVHPEDVDRARLGWQHATRNAVPFDLPYRVRGGDGQFRWHACRALPVRDNAGHIVRWIGTADELGDPTLPRDDAGRIDRQTAQLRTLLETDRPATNQQIALDAATHIAPRDLLVLRLLAAGHTNTAIANLLGLSLRSIEASRSRLRQQLGLRTRAELVQFAHDAGLHGQGT
jgi:PAS domain S-box-containing protein